MFRKSLFVLLVAVMLLMVMAFVVGTAGATIAVVTPKRDVSGYSQGNVSPAESFSAADPSDYFQRHPESVRPLAYYMRLAGR